MIISQDTRLLVISPHPDDEAIGVGGLIGKCKKEKAEVFIVYVSIGRSRQLVTNKTIESSRFLEIVEVEAFAKVKTRIIYIGKEFCRLDTIPQKNIIEKIENIISEVKPNVIAIPSSSSYNQDHRAVFNACITALRPVPKNIRHFVPTVLEYFEPYFWSNNELKKPNAYLDLNVKFQKGTLLDFKINLYKCHKTQVRHDPFPRSPENLIRLAHIYGKEIGVEIAEAYYLLRTEL
jgi:LmbE family N-acetylglucosaminyl deacetylase